MNVFVVLSQMFEDVEIEGVFQSKDDANRFAEKKNSERESEYDPTFSVSEHLLIEESK